MISKNFWIVRITYMLLVFILSSIPMDSGSEDNAHKDWLSDVQNILHVPLFALLSFLWIIAYRGRGHKIKRAVSMGLSITIVYSLLDESHQYYVPGRFMSVADVSLDAIGAFLGGGIY